MSKRKKIIFIILVSILILILAGLIFGILSGRLLSLADLVLKEKESVLVKQATVANFTSSNLNQINISADGVSLARLNAGSKRLSAFERITDLPEKSSGLSAVANAGWLFVIGGSSNGIEGEKVVYRAELEDGGQIKGDSWTKSSFGLPERRFLGSAFIKGNVIYYSGGISLKGETDSVSNKVFYNKIIKNGPQMVLAGAWQETTPLPEKRFAQKTIVRKNFVYVLGGLYSRTGNYLDDADIFFSRRIFRAEILESGALSDWQEEKIDLPLPLMQFSAEVVGDYIYLAGGATTIDGTSDFAAEDNADGTNIISSDKVYRSRIKKDGTLSDWEELTSLPQKRQGHFSFFANGCLYLISGYSFSGRERGENKYEELKNEIICAELDLETGKIKDWHGDDISNKAAAKFLENDAIYDGQALVSRGKLVILAGNERIGGVRDESRRVYSADISGGDPNNSAVSSWQETLETPEASSFFEAESSADKIYLFGGSKNGETNLGTDNLFIGTIEKGGAINKFATSKLPQKVVGHETVRIGKYIYLLGGFEKKSGKGDNLEVVNPYRNVYMVEIKKDGGLSEFKKTKPLPQARFQFGSVAFKGGIFVAGGYEKSGNEIKKTKSVYFADQNPDGTLSAWKKVSDLPRELADIKMETFADYIYVVYGENDGQGRDSVYFAQIKSDNTISEWKQTTFLPQKISTGGLISANGGLYSLAAETYYAPLLGNGEIGSWGWQEVAPLPEFLRGLSCVLAYDSEGKSYIYCLAEKVYFSQVDLSGLSRKFSSRGEVCGRFNLERNQKITRLIVGKEDDITSYSYLGRVFAQEVGIPENSALAIEYRTASKGGEWSEWLEGDAENYAILDREVKTVIFRLKFRSSTDGKRSPLLTAVALTLDQSGGGGEIGEERNLTGGFNDLRGTAGIETSGVLPRTGVSFNLTVVICLILSGLVYLSYRIIKC